ncbi:MAG: hypothetical protein H6553_13195 [Chitinophagales bacterium]|nr:hypothetical protein [Chitinophagales bacterium]
MRKLFILFIMTSLFFTACKNEVKQYDEAEADLDSMTVADETVEPKTDYYNIDDKILQVIQDLPEYQQSNAHIDSISKHTKSVAATITPNKKGTYDVKLGYNGDERFETYYNLSIDTTNWKVMIIDPIEGETLPIETWRKNKQ